MFEETLQFEPKEHHVRHWVLTHQNHFHCRQMSEGKIQVRNFYNIGIAPTSCSLYKQNQIWEWCANSIACIYLPERCERIAVHLWLETHLRYTCDTCKIHLPSCENWRPLRDLRTPYVPDRRILNTVVLFATHDTCCEKTNGVRVNGLPMTLFSKSSGYATELKELNIPQQNYLDRKIMPSHLMRDN